VGISFIRHFFYLSREEIYALPVTEYYLLIEQSFNLAALYRQGEVDLETNADKELELKQKVNMFREFKKHRESINE